MPGQGRQGRRVAMRGELLAGGKAWGRRRGLRGMGVEAACQDLQRELRWLNWRDRAAGPLEAPDPGLGFSRET